MTLTLAAATTLRYNVFISGDRAVSVIWHMKSFVRQRRELDPTPFLLLFTVIKCTDISRPVAPLTHSYGRIFDALIPFICDDWHNSDSD
jgi:hypothetical protein